MEHDLVVFLHLSLAIVCQETKKEGRNGGEERRIDFVESVGLDECTII